MSPISAWHRGTHSLRARAPSTTYSIKGEFNGSVVFITGASGYIGSVVLEQLLRTTNVATVYLLLRPRRGQTIQARANALLQGALFHKVRCNEQLTQKVKVMGGDISMPGLGLSDEDRAVLVSSVDFIVHCAADIRLEADIQETLTANFEGTRTVLELAAAADHLKALVHVSSAFVNMNQPRSSTIDEQVYPLKFGNQTVDVEELAKELLGMPKRDANSRSEVFLQRWKFPNTYTMGKHMSEQLVTRYQAKQQLPVAIVRPSLVSAIAGEPYPGYVGNWAGPIGAGAAMAIGLFDSLESVASQPMGVWDIVPADLVASSIIAAAAAISAGVAAAISRATGSGCIAGTADDAAGVLGRPRPFSPAAHEESLQHTADEPLDVPSGRQHPSSRVKPCNPDLSATIRISEDHELESMKGTFTGVTGSGFAPDKAPHTRSGHTVSHTAMSTRSDDTAMCAGSRVASLVELNTDTESSAGAQTEACSSACTSTSGSPKLRPILVGRRGVHTGKLTQQLLDAVNVQCEDAQSVDLGLSDICEEPARLPLLIVHAATSSTYPLVLMEGWNHNLDFFDAHPQPFRISMRTIPTMGPTFVPTDQNVMACRRRVWWKVWAISSILHLLGKEREAKKLIVGYETFCVHNNSKTDRDLVFSTHALVALEAALDPSEASEYLLVWRPITKRTAWKIKSDIEEQQEEAVAGMLGRSEIHLAPVAGDVVWKRYLHTQMAGIYRLLYGVVPQQHKAMASAAAKARKEGRQLAAEEYIEHDFVRVK